MKYTALLGATVATLAAAASQDPAIDIPSTANDILSPTEALNVIKEANLPAGMKLTGTVDSIQPPNSNASKEMTSTDTDTHTQDSGSVESKQEWLGYGGLGWGGGWGGWGGWGGFGPYRFGWSCGGLGGWAYPLGYWNTFGAGLYGGGCGLGLPWGGLYYC